MSRAKDENGVVISLVQIHEYINGNTIVECYTALLYHNLSPSFKTILAHRVGRSDLVYSLLPEIIARFGA
jgi:hypothetical protein